MKFTILQMASRGAQSNSSRSESQASQQQTSGVAFHHLPPSLQQSQKSSMLSPQSTSGLVQSDTSAKTNIDSQPTLLGLSSNTVKQEKEVSVVSAQAANKQQQQMYGPTVTGLGSQLPRPASTSSLVAPKTQVQDLQMRQITPQGLRPIHPGSNHDVQTTVNEFSRIGGHVSHVTGQMPSQQFQQFTVNKEQKTGSEQAAELENRRQFSSLQGSVFNATQTSFKTEVVEKQTSRVTFSASTNIPMPNQMPGSVASQMETGLQVCPSVLLQSPLQSENH